MPPSEAISFILVVEGIQYFHYVHIVSKPIYNTDCSIIVQPMRLTDPSEGFLEAKSSVLLGAGEDMAA